MRTRLVSLSACFLLLLALALVTSTGCSSGSPFGSGGGTTNADSGGPVAPTPAPAPSAPTARSSANAPATTGSASKDRLVVLNASMQLQVDDLAAAIASIRTLTDTVGGSVSQLTVNSNSESAGSNAPHSASETVRIPGPASASLTVRVPASSLASVEARVSGVGRLISQSSNESDVTQQHMDLSARLGNSRAEEVRLRALLARAGSVTDLLEVERELSRVQGDIESMQAQLAYLEGQAAMATLTISLDQPGPVVRPSGGGWGFVDSVTWGLQGAAALLRALITALLTLSPLIVVGGLLWWFLARRRRARRAAQLPLPDQQPSPAVAPTASAEQPPVDQQP